jgi:LacI family transcriptional regulator
MTTFGLSWIEMGKTMARATIHDVAMAAGLSVSTVNRSLHEPEKVRPETMQAILQAAESVGFYGIGSIRDSLNSTRPKVRIGILLLQRNRAFYKALAAALEAAAAAVRDHEVMIQIEYLEDISPQNAADGLEKLGQKSDVVGIVAPAHPKVSAMIERLAEAGVKTFSLISTLTANCSVGYLGLDAWKVGRTAGWAFGNLCKTPGEIGILVGNHRFRSQEANESGFRSYFREHTSGFTLLEPQSTFENATIAREVTEDILNKHPDLVGLFVSGGGISGALAAVRDAGRAGKVVMIGYDLMDTTRAGLLDGSLNLIISHPLQRLAEATMDAMVRAVDGGPDAVPAIVRLPFDIYTPENL